MTTLQTWLDINHSPYWSTVGCFSLHWSVGQVTSVFFSSQIHCSYCLHGCGTNTIWHLPFPYILCKALCIKWSIKWITWMLHTYLMISSSFSIQGTLLYNMVFNLYPAPSSPWAQGMASILMLSSMLCIPAFIFVALCKVSYQCASSLTWPCPSVRFHTPERWLPDTYCTAISTLQKWFSSFVVTIQYSMLFCNYWCSDFDPDYI